MFASALELGLFSLAAETYLCRLLHVDGEFVCDNDMEHLPVFLALQAKLYAFFPYDL